MTEDSLRRRVNFRDYPYQDWPGREIETNVDLVLAREDGNDPWLVKITKQVPRLRVVARDVYIRWAITINAMHVAKGHYESAGEIGLSIRTQRTDKEGRAKDIILETWHSADAAKNYQRATPALAAYALVDMYGLIEEFTFEFYRIFLECNPLVILKGENFRNERRLFHERERSESDWNRWNSAWNARLDAWQRKRLYDGLNRVFIAFFNESGLKKPSIYKRTTAEDWALVIEAVGEARNLISHGVGKVSVRLEDLSSKLKTNVFKFKEGDTLDIDINHLMFLEGYIHNLLTAISISAFEKRFGPLPAGGE